MLYENFAPRVIGVARKQVLLLFFLKVSAGVKEIVLREVNADD